MIHVWSYFNHMASWMVPIVLGFFTIGIIAPFRSLMVATGYTRRWPWHFFIFINPVIEEVLFRLLLLSFLSGIIGFLPAVIAMSVLYSVYMGLCYGTPAMADGLILGIFLSFAMLEFGFPTVVLAHIVSRVVFSAW